MSCGKCRLLEGINRARCQYCSCNGELHFLLAGYVRCWKLTATNGEKCDENDELEKTGNTSAHFGYAILIGFNVCGHQTDDVMMIEAMINFVTAKYEKDS